MSVRVITLLTLFAALLLAPALPSAAQETITIAVGDLWFCVPAFENGVCATEINVGDTVVWDFSGANEPHTTTECGDSCNRPTSTPLWDSGTVRVGGGPFAFTFDQPGTYLYYCEVHPASMHGELVVQAVVRQPTATPLPRDRAPTSTAAPSGSQAADLPAAGQGLQQGRTGSWWALATLVGTGAVAVGGAAWYARRRWPR